MGKFEVRAQIFCKICILGRHSWDNTCWTVEVQEKSHAKSSHYDIHKSANILNILVWFVLIWMSLHHCWFPGLSRCSNSNAMVQLHIFANVFQYFSVPNCVCLLSLGGCFFVLFCCFFFFLYKPTHKALSIGIKAVSSTFFSSPCLLKCPCLTSYLLFFQNIELLQTGLICVDNPSKQATVFIDDK